MVDPGVVGAAVGGVRRGDGRDRGGVWGGWGVVLGRGAGCRGRVCGMGVVRGGRGAGGEGGGLEPRWWSWLWATSYRAVFLLVCFVLVVFSYRGTCWLVD